MMPLLVFLLACAAVYIGTIQAAFGAMMQLSLRIRAERGDTSEELEAYLEHPLRLFVPARVVMGVILVLATELVGTRLNPGEWHAFGIAFAVMVFFLLLCGQVVPALIVRHQPQRVLELLLPSFDVLASLFRPLTAFLERRASGPDRVAQPDDQSSPDASRIDTAGQGGDALSAGEGRELLRSLVDFSDRLVREVMTPRPDIVAIRAEATLDELRAFFREQEYSRIPVFKDSLDNILGFVFVKDLIKADRLPGDTPLTHFLRPAHFVPETKRVPELLREFQRQQIQSAIVVDEYGGTAGLVSLEDLLEELVGEIRDEYDVEAEPVVEESPDTFVISGRVGFDDVAERLGLQVEPEGFETFGGYLLTHLGRVPQVGETFDVDGLTVEVLEAERRRITKVRVRRQPVSEVTGG